MAVELDDLAGPDGGGESTRLARFWLDQINTVKDNSEQKHWLKRGETIVKRYRDERNRTDEEGHRRYSSLWANVQIMLPALYGKTPLPVAERRFKDRDPAGRAAAQVLERALRNEIEINGYDTAMKAAVTDYLLPGRGTVWVRYEPEIEDSVSLPVESETDMRDAQGELPGRYTPPTAQEQTITTPAGRSRPRLLNNEVVEQDPDKHEQGEERTEEQEKLKDTGDRIIRESTPIDFIEWCDFYTFPIRARSWPEVTAIGKRVYMSRDQMIRRFGKRIGKAIPLQKDQRGDRTQNTMLQTGDEDKGQVYEIWSKDDTTIYWVAMGYDYLLDRKDDPLNLENFYPCPQPLYANPTNNTLIPVPDFIQYQDQAIQIDELTQRIAMLTRACKMTGVYNAAAKDIQRLFDESLENELIPVDDWAAFADQGGVEGNWSLMPVQVIKDVITQLMTVKQQQIEEMDRLTGINDIMRGTSDPRETLGGVRLKTNNTGTRLTYRQNEVARFCRDTIRIMADIMCQHFSPQSLIEASGALYEEGLGPDDMPPLNVLQSAMAQPQPASGPPALASPPMLGQGPPSRPGAMGPSGGTSPPPPGVRPPPPGGNVIPFPGGPPPQPNMPPGMPPGGPQMPPGALTPQIPPEVKAKLDALQRIARGIALLRDQQLRGFRVDIEVDSTIFADTAQEKADRIEFVTQMTQFIQMGAQLGSVLPPAVPLLGKMLGFAARGFRIGRDLEVAIEEFTDQAAAFAQQHAQQMAGKQSPEEIQAETEKMKAAAQIQGIQLKNQAEQKSADAEVQRQQVENQGEMANSQADMQIKQMELQMRQMEMEIEKIRAQVDLAKVHAEAHVQGLETQHKVVEMGHEQQKIGHEQQQMLHEHHQSNLEASHEQQRMHLEQQQAKREASHEGKMMKHEEKQSARENTHEGKMMEHKERLAEQQAKAAAKKPAGGK